MPLITIIEKIQEPACSEPDDCCGYYYVEGRSELVDVDIDTYDDMREDIDDLCNWEDVDPLDYGIDTSLSNIGWMMLVD